MSTTIHIMHYVLKEQRKIATLLHSLENLNKNQLIVDQTIHKNSEMPDGADKELAKWYKSLLARRVENVVCKVSDAKQSYSVALVKALEKGAITQEQFNTRMTGYSKV
jgi:hypothetical protein